MRLWPDAVEALFGAPDALPRITPGWEKRYLALDNAHHRFQASPLELRAVYLLGERAEEGGATRVEAATGKSALMSLVAETYATRMIDAALRAREFELLGRLVEHVPVRRLAMRPGLRHIAGLCETVLRDVETLAMAA